MIIEFFGIPGGGKTHLMWQLIIRMPDACEARALSRHEITRGASRFALRHPLSFLVWMGELGIHANGLFRYKIGLLLRAMAARAEAESGHFRTALIDEGLLQRMLTIFDVPLSRRHIKFLLTMTPLAQVVVCMYGGEFSRFAAARNRFNSPRVSGGEERLRTWMQVVEMNASLIASLLPQYMGVVTSDRGRLDTDPASVRERIECFRSQNEN